jgi:hypothetical protein
MGQSVKRSIINGKAEGAAAAPFKLLALIVPPASIKGTAIVLPAGAKSDRQTTLVRSRLPHM